MPEGILSEAISSDEFQHFKARHPAFDGALTRLHAMLNTAFVRDMRPLPGNPENQQVLVFFLGHQAVEEFFDIVLLAVHGKGLAALRLLRPLYERVVTAVYLMEHPEDVQGFNDYADVHAHRVINHATASGLDVKKLVSTERRAELKAAYERVQKNFTETLCAKCGTTRPQQSWTKKSLKALAEQIGLGQLYAGAAFWPTMLLHTTRVGLESRLSTSPEGLLFEHGPQCEDADRALGYAHAFIVQLLYASNRFFELGLDVQPILEDVETCWGHVGTGASQTASPTTGTSNQ